MTYSSYQVQRLVTRLRRVRQAAAQALGGSPEVPATQFAPDPVTLSQRAREQAAAAADVLRLPAGTPVSPAKIVDAAPLPLPTRIELERRAGSFMRPPLVPSPPPAQIPRTRRFRAVPPTEATVAADPSEDGE